VHNLLQLLGFAAIVSFVTSPILAVINFVVMRGDNVPAEHRPGPVLTVLSWAGILFFFGMTGGFIYAQFLAA
jgi:Mn2+/Fe2+ NRAMP family transporter